MAFFASTAQRGRDDDERRSQFDQLGKRAAETLGLSLRPMDIDNDVLARGVSQLAQADHERVDEVLIGGSGAGLHKADARCGLLRLRATFPRGDEQAQSDTCNERAAIHHRINSLVTGSAGILRLRTG